MEDIFITKLIENLKKYNVNQYILNSLDTWIEYIKSLGLMDETVSDHLTDKDKKNEIDKFIKENGILNIQYNQDNILKRHILGFDRHISISKTGHLTFKEFFEDYEEYLKDIKLNNIMKLKIIISSMANKIKTVPKLAIFNTIENNWSYLSYNISYSNGITESLTMNVIRDIDEELAIISDERNNENIDLIESEIFDIYALLSEGLFSLIIHDKYPKTLEKIFPQDKYKSQINERIFKNEIPVKYEGKIYKSIEINDSYITIDEDLHIVEDAKKAKAIYCKANLAKSMFK